MQRATINSPHTLSSGASKHPSTHCLEVTERGPAASCGHPDLAATSSRRVSVTYGQSCTARFLGAVQRRTGCFLVEITIAGALAQAAVSTLAAIYRQRRQQQDAASTKVLDTLVAEYGLPDPGTAAGDSTKELVTRLETSPKATEAAFALSPDAVFNEARARLRLFFRINVGVCLAVSTVLVGALAAALVLALVGRTALAGVFGALSLGDIVFAAAYGPLKRIEAALVATQRLDIIHLSTRERLSAAQELTDPSARVRETERIWEDIKNDLAALSADSDH